MDKHCLLREFALGVKKTSEKYVRFQIVRRRRPPMAHAGRARWLLKSCYYKSRNRRVRHTSSSRGGSRGEIRAIGPPKTYESNFINHELLQFGKQHSRYDAILLSSVLSQRCCELYIMPRCAAVMRLDYQINRNRTP